MNLSPVTNASTEFPFIDRFKSVGQWVIVGGSYGAYADAPGNLFDANGWPLGQPDQTDFRMSVQLDPLNAPIPTTRYELTYSGTATFGFTAANVVSREPGKIVIDAPYGGIAMSIVTTNSDPVHDIHIVRQDEVAAFNAGEIFDPAFLARAQNWSVLRFMDWSGTNGNQITSWDQRVTPSHASWGMVPLEVQVQLSNEAHSDMWMNIPAMADDNYVRQALTYVHDHLDPNLKVHVEYSNEVWNNGFQQSNYAQQQADARWGNGSSIYWGSQVYYGYRSAQISAIGKDVFGSSFANRYDGVLSTFTWWTNNDVDDAIANGVSKANVGSIGDLFKQYAVTTYFGDSLGVSPGNEHDRPIVLQWAQMGAAGLDLAFQQLQHGGLLQQDFSLDSLIPLYAFHEAKAQAWGLDMVAYEGGLSSYWFASDQQGILTDFFQRLLDDPRMGQLYTRMVNDFKAAGGDELTAFTDTGVTTVFGPWGTTKDIYSTSPRYEALLAASRAGNGSTGGTTVTTPTVTVPVVTTPIVTAPVADPTVVSTSNATYTLADGAVQLTYTGSGSFTGTGNALANTINGGNGGSHLYGLDGNDTLIGGNGDDYLDGGTGADIMRGGAGNDIYIVDNVGDQVIEGVNAGTDEVRTTLASYTLPDNVENLTYTGSGNFTGTGNALNNIIKGGAGNDCLDGGAGADQLIGGAGNDVYIVDNMGDIVIENPNEGIDEVRTSLNSYALPDNVENLTYTGPATTIFYGYGNALDNVIKAGSGASFLYGMDGNDTLIGGAGNDYLDGGTGADIMRGGAGNDIYIVDNVGDQVIENPNEGIDEVRTTLATYTLTANVENLTFIGTGAFTGNGNELDNVIKAGDGGSRLFGGAGNDTLIGGAGADYLDGGTGADIMRGGAGNDIYIVDNVGDQVIENPNEGTDEVRTTLNTYTLPANVENLTFIGTGHFYGTGNELDNVIKAGDGGSHLYGGAGSDTLMGGAGADYLDGGTGADIMIGGAGNDVYIVDNVGDQVIEQPNGGLDEVRTTLATYTLTANVENLTFIGTGNFTGYGNDGDNLITGGAGNDRLFGGAGRDTLVGGWGNDYLDGGAGADKMIGGMGDDTYIVDDAGDKVLENPGEGYDTVMSSVTYTLPANVERLILTGSAAIDGTGNNLANALYGNAANNRLFGMAGDDYIDGGAGDDYIDGGTGNDVIIGGAGKDTLTGGLGADTFVFKPGDMGSTLATADWITDFSHAEGDRINFSALRLSPGTPLTFMGANAFDGHAGEVRAVASGSNYDVMIDLNGDGVADLHLLVTSRTGALVSNDFIL